MPEVRKERTGFRDEWISNRHRDFWGWDCPAVDIDFLMVEYDNGIPVALIEYKHEMRNDANTSPRSWQALEILSTRARIPLFKVVYSSKMKLFWVEPKNQFGRGSISMYPIQQGCTEIEYVTFLYSLRNRGLPFSVADAIEKARTLTMVEKASIHKPSQPTLFNLSAGH